MLQFSWPLVYFQICLRAGGLHSRGRFSGGLFGLSLFLKSTRFLELLSCFDAWFDSGYTLMHPDVELLDDFTTCPLHPAVTCSVAALPEEYKHFAWLGRCLQDSVFSVLARLWLHGRASVFTEFMLNLRLFLRGGGPWILRSILVPCIRQALSNVLVA